MVDGESEASKFERNVSFHSSSRSRSRDRSLTCHPELVMSASSSPTKADSNIGRSTNRKREAGNKRLPLFGSDTLILQNRQRQAQERKDNAGRYCAQLSEANRALFPTRVHRHVIAHEAFFRFIGSVSLKRWTEHRPRIGYVLNILKFALEAKGVSLAVCRPRIGVANSDQATRRPNAGCQVRALPFFSSLRQRASVERRNSGKDMGTSCGPARRIESCRSWLL